MTAALSSNDAIAAVAGALAGAPLCAFDLEFVTADRLTPVLCLVQVAWVTDHRRFDAPDPATDSGVEVAVLDAIAGDVAPVVHALAAHGCVVAHAPRQDLQILAAQFGAQLPGVIDTQIMAAFAGVGEQVGLATLAAELLGVKLAKEQQWTNWMARPLSPAQLTYAAADVRYLPALHARLLARLGPRAAWAAAETEAIAAEAHAAAAITAETAWKQLGLRGVDPATAASAAALAAWRFRVAHELDKPLGWVIPDKTLLDVARARPAAPGELRAAKGMTAIARQRADDMLAALAAARGQPTPLAPGPAWKSPSPRAQRWADVLLAIAAVVGDQEQIAPRLLANRADAEDFARAVDQTASPSGDADGRGQAPTVGDGGPTAVDATRVMTSWRREVLGEVWLRWLSGGVVLAGDLQSPRGVRLEPKS